MQMITLDIVLRISLLVGAAMSLVGWIFCRRPGVPLSSGWAWKRPTDYATPLGVFLYFGGFVILAISLVLLYVL
jgi:hypothetical protein